jgi:hypothetical protein
MKSPSEILVGPDSIRLIYPALNMETGILMRYVGLCEQECYPFDGQFVKDVLRAEKSVREMRERTWL